MIIGMALVLSFSLSPSFFEENVSDTETSQGSVTTGLNVAKTFIRQPAHTLSKLVFHTQELPLLFMVYLLEIPQLPSFWLPFKHCIMLLLRRLFLDPIKYTSTFVSRANLSVL